MIESDVSDTAQLLAQTGHAHSCFGKTLQGLTIGHEVTLRYCLGRSCMARGNSRSQKWSMLTRQGMVIRQGISLQTAAFVALG